MIQQRTSNPNGFIPIQPPKMLSMNHCAYLVFIFSVSSAFTGESEIDLEDLVGAPFLSSMFGRRVG